MTSSPPSTSQVTDLTVPAQRTRELRIGTPPAGSRVSEPRVGEGELLEVRLAHRLARRDTRRLALVADGLASGTSRFSEKRALAFGDQVERVCYEIARDHHGEDERVWPLLERHAGPAVDLTDLTGDHVALYALLDEVRRGARAVVAALVLRPSPVATARDFARMRDLAERLAELTELVEEHLADTERVLFAVLGAHVPRAAWHRALGEPAARRTGPWGAGRRVLSVATAAETAVLRDRDGTMRALGRRLGAGRLRRRERLVYGTDAVGPADPAGSPAPAAARPTDTGA